MIKIFSSVLGLFGLIIGLLVSSKAAEFEWFRKISYLYIKEVMDDIE